jgi:hypothetical protein
LFLLFWAGNDLDRILNLYILLVPVLFLPALVWATTLVDSLGASVIRRRWRRTMSIIAAPIIAGSVFFLFGKLGITTELIRLELGKSSYMAEVAALPDTNGGRRLKIWSWGSTGGAAVANFSSILVYNESDQIALPRSSWSAEWRRNADQADSDGRIPCFGHNASFFLARPLS